MALPNTGDFARKKSPTGGEIQELCNSLLAKSPRLPGVPPSGKPTTLQLIHFFKSFHKNRILHNLCHAAGHATCHSANPCRLLPSPIFFVNVMLSPTILFPDRNNAVSLLGTFLSSKDFVYLPRHRLRASPLICIMRSEVPDGYSVHFKFTFALRFEEGGGVDSEISIFPCFFSTFIYISVVLAFLFIPCQFRLYDQSAVYILHTHNIMPLSFAQYGCDPVESFCN